MDLEGPSNDVRMIEELLLTKAGSAMFAQVPLKRLITARFSIRHLMILEGCHEKGCPTLGLWNSYS
jgi:hypothetical protein